MTELRETVEMQWFEVEIPVRGCHFDLKQIQKVYCELDELNQREGDRLIASLIKPQDQPQEEFNRFCVDARKKAFKITVSIIGSEDNITKYGEEKSIFEKSDLPFPINTIFITNDTAFRSVSNGQSPPNMFQLWIHFNKPPLFDPNPLVSDPTRNPSKIKVKSDNSSYLRAIQTITNKELKKKRLFFYLVHEKFAYDIGMWFVALPYVLYMTTKTCDRFFPSDGRNASYRVAIFIY